MPDVTASYGRPFDIDAFFWVFSYIIVSEVFYIDQTFTDCGNNQYALYNMSVCQM